MVEGPSERSASNGMVRQRTFTKEEQRNSNTNKDETEAERNTGQEGSWPERRQRKQWRSQGGLTAGEKIGHSPILDDFFLKEKERCSSSGSSYGGVVPQLRLRLAEQGDPTAQLEIAREVIFFQHRSFFSNLVFLLSRCCSGWLGVRCQRLKFHLKKRSSY